MEDSYHLEHRVHIYIRGRCCVVGGVKNSQNCTVLAGGHHLPAFFRSLGRATCKVPILCIYYNAIQAPADRERLRCSMGSSPARGEEARGSRDNQFITAGASAHLHTRGRRRSRRYLAVALFAFSAQLFAPVQIAALKLDANSPSIALHGRSSRDAIPGKVLGTRQCVFRYS